MSKWTDTRIVNILPFSPLWKMVEDFCIRHDSEKKQLANKHSGELSSFLRTRYKNLTINDFVKIFSRSNFQVESDILQICVIYFFKKSLTEKHHEGINKCIKVIYQCENIFWDFDLTDKEKQEIRRYSLSQEKGSFEIFMCEEVFPWLETERKTTEQRNKVVWSIEDILKWLFWDDEKRSVIFEALHNISRWEIKLKESTYKNITRKIIDYLIENKNSNILMPLSDNEYLKLANNFHELIKYSWNKKIMDYIDFYSEYREKVWESSEVLWFIQDKINTFQQNEIDVLSQEELERIRKLGIVIQSTGEKETEIRNKLIERKQKVLAFITGHWVDVSNPHQKHWNEWYPKHDMRYEVDTYILKTSDMTLYKTDAEWEEEFIGIYGWKIKAKKIPMSDSKN